MIKRKKMMEPEMLRTRKQVVVVYRKEKTKRRRKLVALKGVTIETSSITTRRRS